MAPRHRFTLVVDDFTVRYTNRADALHLLTALREHYQVTKDWDTTRYCGLSLFWDYAQRTVDLSMPGYIARALQHFRHPTPARPEHSPHAWQPPSYGATTQLALAPDTSDTLDPAARRQVEEVIGVLLYYARAVDPTLLVALNTLAAQQANATQATAHAIHQLLDYCAMHPDAAIRFHASDMVLWTHSDTSYLSAPQSRSRAAGYSFLSSRPTSPPTTTDPAPPDNGPVHVLCQIMRQVVASAAEAELGALFLNTQAICPIRVALEELGHPQPPTPLQTDNNTASNSAAPRPLTCDFTGSATARARVTSMFFGGPATLIGPTISPSITPLRTIRPCALNTCSPPSLPPAPSLLSRVSRSSLVRVC